MSQPKRCPTCRKPQTAECRPFCSKRCADVDLNRWLKGAYVIPGSPVEDEDGDAVNADVEDRRDD